MVLWLEVLKHMKDQKILKQEKLLLKVFIFQIKLKNQNHIVVTFQCLYI